MTEAEWLTPGDLEQHVNLMRGRKHVRKLRLFCVACCRPFEPWVTVPFTRESLLRSELLADGKIRDSTMREWLQKLRREAMRVLWAAPHSRAAASRREREAFGAVQGACRPTNDRWGEPATWRALVTVHRVFGVDLVRRGPALAHAYLLEMFGNPFRPVVFSPEWRTDTAVTLARQMYDAREFSAMPILADALQDAGCDSDDILNHARGPGPHVRGCWVVDLVLGKE